MIELHVSYVIFVTLTNRLNLFLGLKYFNELAKKKKRTGAFKPPQSQSLRKIWDDAITSCSKMMKRSKKERLEISTKSWENRDNNKNPDQRNGPNISTVQINSNPSESNQRESLFLNFQPLNASNLSILDQPSGTLTEEVENNSPNAEKDSVQENISNDNELMETEDAIEKTQLPAAVDSVENPLDSRNQSESKLTTDMVLIHSDTIKSETEEIQQEVSDEIEPSSVVEAQLDSNSGNDHSELQCPTFDSFQIANRGSEKKGKQITEENLQDALEEIRSGQDALVTCKKFSIPSIILYKGMKQSILEDALKSGQSIISASEKYKTALSILEEKLKKIVAKKRYTDENLLDALKGIQNGLCVNASSEKYNVPGGTLRDWKRRLNLESLASNPTTHKNQENVDTENNSASKEIEGDDDDIPDFSQPITEQQTNFDQSEAQISNEIQGSDTSPTLKSGSTALTKRGCKQHNWTEEDILEAFNDIRNGQSVSATAKKYNIPNSTLDERVKNKQRKGKQQNWTEQDMLEALNDIRNGQSIVASSKKYNIPTSTLGERVKKNNVKSTCINKIGQSTNNEYTEEDVLEALNDIKNGQSITASSKKYNIPNSTLRDRLKKMGEEVCKKFNIPLTTRREKAKKSNIKSSFTNGRETDQSTSTELNPAQQQEISEDHELAETEGLSPFLNPIERTPISSPAPRNEESDIFESSPDIKDEVPEETLIADMVLTHSNEIKSETEEVTARGEDSESQDSNSRKSNSESESPISNEIQGTSPSLESIDLALTRKGKQHNWTEQDMLEALNDIRNGQSIVASSKKYNIPTSTLGERMKKNNIKSTFINKIVTTKKYTEKDMLEALNDIKNGQSILESSKKYNIPRTTLHDRLKKMGEDCESQETNPIEGLEGDPEISFNLSPEVRKSHSSVRIDRRLADRVMYLMNNGIQVQYNQVDDFKVQGN